MEIVPAAKIPFDSRGEANLRTFFNIVRTTTYISLVIALSHGLVNVLYDFPTFVQCH